MYWTLFLTLLYRYMFYHQRWIRHVTLIQRLGSSVIDQGMDDERGPRRFSLLAQIICRVFSYDEYSNLREFHKLEEEDMEAVLFLTPWVRILPSLHHHLLVALFFARR